MSDKSNIEWTESTWNPITGCSVISAGCKHCYAMKLAGGQLKNHPSRAGLTVDSSAGPVWTGEVRFNEQWLRQPIEWKRPREIFVCAHADLFHENVPDEWIDRVFAVMALADQHVFQVLTKRPSRMLAYMERLGSSLKPLEVAARLTGHTLYFKGLRAFSWPLPNVWLGVSTENQETADERIPLLMQTPAAVRWISAEPLLGPIDLEDVPVGMFGPLRPQGGAGSIAPKLDWVVVGGESKNGTGARPMHPDWVRRLHYQCARADVPFFFKQWGNWALYYKSLDQGEATMYVLPDGKEGAYSDYSAGKAELMSHVGKKASGRLLDGVLHDAYPVRT